MQITLKTDHRSTLKTAGWVLPIAIVFPILVHLAPPINGVPVGAYLLPMFYIPFVALVAYRLPVALIVAALAPPLNFLITGNPQWGLMGILTIELVTFTFLAYALLLPNTIKWFAAPLAYLGAKTISSAFLIFIPLIEVAPYQFFSTSLNNAATGILILLVINILSLKYLPSQEGAD
ncbi:hypothetical protein [Cyclobacterium qasimii]|uniref:ECF transporter S component n=2 Tax=Cyclobacterium qasimii TaxID=1350429 RepID=S7VCG8_9BACT|nr:hypothetical protein [Cyclobacterium qasimii]EPR67671.1 hypothetical protein ADICYQ_3311 [Cyclobacterium qasimii M12-11B]GEO19501.1 hypothetical protein CQA01_00350 [Cyclobacterium qasimii]